MPTHRGPVYGGHARTFSLTACLALLPMHVAASPCWMVFIRLAHRRGVGWCMKQGQPSRARLIQKAGMFGEKGATQGVLEAAGWLDQILILLLWQNGIMGQKLGCGWAGVCLHMPKMCILLRLICVHRHKCDLSYMSPKGTSQCREASSIFFLLDLSSAYVR